MGHDIYSVSQQGAGASFAVMIVLTIAVCGIVFGMYQWRGWWIVVLAAFVVPALTSLAFARFRWPGSVKEFFLDVVLPLALTVGAISAFIGIAIGWLALRFLLRA